MPKAVSLFKKEKQLKYLSKLQKQALLGKIYEKELNNYEKVNICFKLFIKEENKWQEKIAMLEENKA